MSKKKGTKKTPRNAKNDTRCIGSETIRVPLDLIEIAKRKMRRVPKT